jgi:hypothetical protein
VAGIKEAFEGQGTVLGRTEFVQVGRIDDHVLVRGIGIAADNGAGFHLAVNGAVLLSDFPAAAPAPEEAFLFPSAGPKKNLRDLHLADALADLTWPIPALYNAGVGKSWIGSPPESGNHSEVPRMVATLPSMLLPFPAELVNAVARDADRVGAFLHALGIQATPQRPVALPAGFLLDLGAALRLLCWEQAGLNPQQVAGLPPAQQGLRTVLQALSESPGDDSSANPPGTLACRVMQAFVDHFAWNGDVELNVDVLLRDADEDLLLEALADFLWVQRPV